MAGIAGEHFMARTDTQILIGKGADLPDPWPERGEKFSVVASEWEPQSRQRGERQPRGGPEQDIER
jgi:hypothetical protein